MDAQIKDCDIKTIMTQTSYTENESKTHLINNNYDVIKVIQYYLNDGVDACDSNNISNKKKISVNQEIFKQYRKMLPIVYKN
jgi:hypothetical protein